MTKAKTAKTKKKAAEPKGSHGGKREGSGKPSMFPGKLPEARAILLTAKANKIVERKRAELKISRSDFHEALTRLHGSALTSEDIQSAMD